MIFNLLIIIMKKILLVFSLMLALVNCSLAQNFHEAGFRKFYTEIKSACSSGAEHVRSQQEKVLQLHFRSDDLKSYNKISAIIDKYDIFFADELFGLSLYYAIREAGVRLSVFYNDGIALFIHDVAYDSVVEIVFLLCASNSNNVLTDFINSGVYDKRREFYKTVSPSMDILVSSNLERLLYAVTNENAEKVAALMEKLNNEGSYKIEEEHLKIIQSEFFGAWVDEVETKEAIARVYSDYNYLMDTHTAVAWRALEKYRLLTSDDTFTIVLSTASPYKFCDSVLEALEDKKQSASDPFALLHKLNEKTNAPIPERMLALETAPILHSDVIAANAMEEAVVEYLK